MSQWAGVVLAAGMGVRMKSRLPKVLHPVCGKEMVRYPVDLLQGLGVERILVVVSPTNRVEVEKALGDKVEYVEQATANGTVTLCCKRQIDSWQIDLMERKTIILNISSFWAQTHPFWKPKV